MRRVLYTIAFMIIFSLAGLVPAFSDSSSATLKISATVPQTVGISVESSEQASNLDFSDNPEDVLLGTVREMSNSRDGYEVHVSSKNGAELDGSSAYFTASGGDISSVIPYDITYDGEPVEFSNGSAKISEVSGETALGSGNSREVRLARMSQDAMPEPGSYSDTLTFTISTK